MNEIEVSGKTIEEAIQEGLTKLSCSREMLDIKILNEGTSGLFGLMGNKPARVRLTTKNGSGTGPSSIETQLKDYAGELLKLMNLDCSEIITTVKNERTTAEIKSKDSRFIIGRNGQTLDALENIISLMLNRNREPRIRITLDSEGYRQQQEQRLEALASKALSQVKSSKKSFRFDPMSSKDRRIIHMFLKNDPAVETISEGEGALRKVVVKLKKKS